MAAELKVPLLLTLDSHFVRPDQKFLQDILLKQGSNGWHFYTTYAQYSLAESWELWRQRHPDMAQMARHFAQAVEANSELVSRIQPMAFEKKYHLPPVTLPIEIASLPEKTEDEKCEEYVLQLIAQHGRFPSTEPERSVYATRLRTELDTICRNGKANFLRYFIALHDDVCEPAKAEGILMSPGRGSAAGCLLSYLLGITNLDPIKWDLSFARFLSRGRINRGKFPDIDMDFGNPKVIADRLKENYGEKFARICTTGTMGPKTAIRDVSRVLLNTQDDKEAAAIVDVVCKSMSTPPQGMSDMQKWLWGWEDGEGAHKGEVEINDTLAEFFQNHPDVTAAVNDILGTPKSMGRHASAFCLADHDLSVDMPMCTLNDEICIQYTMEPVEKLGYVKIDLLGLNTLKDISTCLALIKSRHGIDIDVYNIPDGDPEAFKSFCDGRNETVFQFNSDLSIGVCKSIQPKCIKDLSDITAAGRPGTMYALTEDGKTTLIESWISRRDGKTPVTYVHPSMQPALESTLGICIYQEQLMRLFQDCCGFSEERADEIREIVGKKKKDQVDALLPEIRTTLTERQWEPAQIESFISLIQAAGSYAFNKSHSLAYAYLGYVCQWLKTHYALEWWTAVLQHSTAKDLDTTAKYCSDIVLPPNINNSDLDFYIIDEGRGKIVFPLGMIRGVKSAGVEILAKKPFTSIEDFYARVDRTKVNKGVVAALVWAGAFDALHGVEHPEDRSGIFQQYLLLRGFKKEIESFKPASPFQALINQNQALPMQSADFSTSIREQTKNNHIVGLAQIDNIAVGRKIFVAGCVVAIREIKDKKGGTMAFVEIIDQSNSLSITFFSGDWQKCKHLIQEENIILCLGELQEYRGRRSCVSKGMPRVYGELNKDIPLDKIQGDLDFPPPGGGK